MSLNLGVFEAKNASDVKLLFDPKCFAEFRDPMIIELGLELGVQSFLVGRFFETVFNRQIPACEMTPVGCVAANSHPLVKPNLAPAK